MKLYLSPSNQPANKYAVGNTNEKEQMEALAKVIHDGLKNYDLEPVMASFSLGISKAERPTEAKKKGAGFYFAIHSNAGGGGTGRGAVAFYHPESAISKKLADNLIVELNKITPHGENRSNQVVNGMTAINGKSMGEIRSPFELGIPSLLLEVDFHDNPVTAKYIIENRKTIADAIIGAVVKTFDLNGTNTPKPPQNVPQASEKAGFVKVIYDGADGLNVRTNPDFKSGVNTIVRKGEVFTVIGEVGDFYKLKSGLYITKNPKFVEFIEPETFKPYLVRINANVLNIRDGSNVKSKDVGNVFKGEVYTIVDEQNGFGRLKSGAGWISLKYVDKLS